MKIAGLIAASIAALSFVLGTGVWWCVLKGDARRNWYCICCLLWGKQNQAAAVQEHQRTVNGETFIETAERVLGKKVV